MELGLLKAPIRPALAGAALFACGALLAQPAAESDVSRIVNRMAQLDREQEKNLHGYQVLRVYRLRNEDGTRTVEATARVTYDRTGAKTIKVMEERGAEGLFRRAIRKVIEGEAKASDDAGRREMRLSPENYDFRMLGTENMNGRRCHVLQLTPKRKSKYLLDGRVWVDAQEFAPVRLEGRPSAAISFWVGKPYIIQSFGKAGEMWLLAHNESRVDARFVGRIDLTIETRQVEGPGIKVALRAPGPAKAGTD